ncbi:hypothetical protein ACXHRU_002305 [Listeria monocytogenes]
MTDAQYFGYLIGSFFAFSSIVLSLYVAACRIIARIQKKNLCCRTSSKTLTNILTK